MTARAIQARAAGEYFSLRCDDCDYALDIMTVRENRTWIRPPPLPQADSDVQGVLNP